MSMSDTLLYMLLAYTPIIGGIVCIVGLIVWIIQKVRGGSCTTWKRLVLVGIGSVIAWLVLLGGILIFLIINGSNCSQTQKISDKQMLEPFQQIAKTQEGIRFNWMSYVSRSSDLKIKYKVADTVTEDQINQCFEKTKDQVTTKPFLTKLEETVGRTPDCIEILFFKNESYVVYSAFYEKQLPKEERAKGVKPEVDGYQTWEKTEY